jgi:hypothetical protein
LLDLRTFIEPDEVELLSTFLLLLNLDCPEALYTLRLMCSWCVVVSFMGIAFGYSESKEGEWKELEGVFKGGAVRDLGEEGVLLAGFGVCWRFKSPECTLNWEVVNTLG